MSDGLLSPRLPMASSVDQKAYAAAIQATVQSLKLVRHFLNKEQTYFVDKDQPLSEVHLLDRYGYGNHHFVAMIPKAIADSLAQVNFQDGDVDSE